LGRTVYGRVAGSVLERAPVPVLVARAWLPVRQPALHTDHPRVLVPLDGSAFAEAALPVAADLALTLRGSLALIRAVAPADPVAALVRRGVEPGPGEALDHGGQALDRDDQRADRLRLGAVGRLFERVVRLRQRRRHMPHAPVQIHAPVFVDGPGALPGRLVARPLVLAVGTRYPPNRCRPLALSCVHRAPPVV
ncbi:MAG TPA: hypothetical protein VFW96_02640, partial [Thermomicrobiales bacterium]|nr:hypothetical protein [Thermomicrobiales bacterium]